MNLVIDIGNSWIKYALFSEDQLVEEYSSRGSDTGPELLITEKSEAIDACMISAVSELPETLSSRLVSHGIPYFCLDMNTKLPFRNLYQSKDTLGPDRIAGVAGACLLYPEENVLIIDAGTALTFDLKTEKNEYLGGNISPGIAMRFRALHEQTRKLPLLQAEETGSVLGRSTREAIINGVSRGLIYEVNAYLEELDDMYPGLVVLLTGGDHRFFDNRLKKTIFVVSNLTLLGLNFILRYNAKK